MKCLKKILAVALVFSSVMSPLTLVLAQDATNTTITPVPAPASSSTPDTQTPPPAPPPASGPSLDTPPPSSKSSTPPPASLLSSPDERITPVDQRDPLRRAKEPEATDGSFSYSFPLRVPPGRNGMQPDLALQYNSNGARNDDLFGYGWSINIPYIQRINKTGTENLYSTTSTQYFTSSLDGELATTSASSTASYGPRVENGNFRTYTYSTTTGWTVTDKTGKVFTFGTTTASQLNNGSSQVYRWMLDSVRDTNGNYMVFTYYQDSNLIYPNTITYTYNAASSSKFEIDFTRTSVSGIPTYFYTGFSTQRKYRINDIQMKVDDGLVTKYSLYYAVRDNGYGEVLNSIIESGQDENGTTRALPPTTFGYQILSSAQKGWTVDNTWDVPTDFTSSTGTVDYGARFGDVNGDGIADLLRSDLNVSQAWENESASTSWLQNASYIPPTNFVQGAADTGLRLLDVNGDGIADVVRSQGGTSSKVHFNDGTGWTASTSWNVPVEFTSATGTTDYGVRFGDVNGDGLVDMVQALTGSTSAVYTNNGDGTGWTKKSSYALPASVTFTGGTDDHGLRLEDADGDGLSDLLFSTDASNTVYRNKGDGTGWAQDTGWSNPVPFVSYGVDTGTRLADVNGDGLVDVVRRATTASGTYINTNTGWQLDPNWRDAVAEFADDSGADGGTRIVDVNGDGLPDLIRGIDGGTHAIYLNNGKAADLLTSITESTGGKTTVTYTATAAQSSQVGTSSLMFHPHLPFTIQTVNTTTKDDGYGTVGTSTYGYRGGNYYYKNARDRKVAAFESITKTDPFGHSTKTYYHQGNVSNSTKGEYNDGASKIGKPYRVLVNDSEGNQVSKTINKWDMVDLGNDRKFVKLTNTLEFSHTFAASSDSADPHYPSSWIAEENFNSYTSGDNLNGKSGGSGWNGNWTSVGGSAITVTNEQAYEGSLSIKTTGNNAQAYRSLSAISDGTLYIAMRKASNSAGVWYVSLGPTWATRNMYIRADTTGNIQMYDGQAYQTISSYSANQWYLINIEFDDSNFPDQYRARVYGGSAWTSFSPWYTVSSYSAIGVLGLEGDCSGTICYWDDITATNPNSPPAADPAASWGNGVQAHSYTYDSYGNITGKKDWGAVFGNDDGTFGDLETDLASTSIAYAASSTGNLVGLPSDVIMTDYGSSTVKETRLYYDNQSLGNITAGNLTKKEDLVSGSTYVNTQKSYTPFGLVSQDVDARGNATTYRYDKFQQYVATTTDSLGHITQAYYDYSLGKPKATIDANGRESDTVYDSLDRVSAVKVPDLSNPSTLATTTAYAYTDTALPNVVIETQYLNSASTTTSYRFLDGFGRAFQEWKSAEATSTYAVRDFAYDKRGLLAKESIPYFASTTTPPVVSGGGFTASETFESYSTGALNGDNGGSGWAGAWGDSGLVCETDIGVDNSSLIDGKNSLSVNVDLDTNDTCERELSTYVVGTQAYQFKVRVAQATDRLFVWLTQDRVAQGANEPGIQINFWSNGQIRVIDNVSWVDLQAYSANTTYTITVYPNVPAETYTVSINGGAPYGPYHFNSYGSITYTALKYFHVQDGADISSGNLYLDSITNAATQPIPFNATTTSSAFTNYYYDALGRPASTSNVFGVTTFTYDDWHATTTDPLGHVKEIEKDAFGNLIRVNEVNATSTYATMYAYDRLGDLTKITDALGNIRNFTYEGLGRRLTAEDLHASGDSTFGTWTYTYDNNGNVSSVVDPKNQTINYTYDSVNRVQTEDFTGQSGTEVQYVYDSCADGIGRLCSASTTQATTTYTYYANGQKQTETQQIGTTTATTTFAYDRQGNVTTLTYSDGAQTTYTYNSAGLIEAIAEKENGSGATTTMVSDIDYGPHRKTTFQSFFNGLQSKYTYDANAMWRLTNKKTGTSTQVLGWSWFMPHYKIVPYDILSQWLPSAYAQDAGVPEGSTTITDSNQLIAPLIPDVSPDQGGLIFGADTSTISVEPQVTPPDTAPSTTALDLPLPSDQIESTTPQATSSNVVTETQVSSSIETSPPATSGSEVQGQATDTAPISSVDAMMMTVDGRDIPLEFADNNDGENLIIRSDAKDYFGWGSVTVYFGVENTSADTQNIDIAFALKGQPGWKVRSVRKLTGEKISEEATTTVPAVIDEDGSTTPEVIIPARTIRTSTWEDKTETTFSHWSDRKKSVGEDESAYEYPISSLAPGERAYYEAVIDYPVASQGGEFFIEAFGDKGGYGHLDPNAWTSEDNFNSYSDGNNLNGGSGGSGWGGNWTQYNSNQITTETSVTYEGAAAAKTTVNAAVYYRNLSSSLTSGSVYVAMQKTSTSSGNWYFTLEQGAFPNDRMVIRAFTDGNIAIYDNSLGYQTITTYNPNQWYVINVEFDDSGHPDQYRARVYDGSSWSSFSSWYTVYTGSYTGINYVSIQGDCSGTTCYWDDITPNDPTIQPPPPTVSVRIQDLTYTYDAVGNITSIVDSSNSSTTKNVYFGYDDLYRLTSASTTNASTSPDYLQTWGYNALGNMATSSTLGTYSYGSTNYANPHAPTTIGSMMLAYDSNGNLASTTNGATVWRYGWDYRNEMTSAASGTATTTFGYDHVGNRVSMRSTGSASTTFANRFFNQQGATITKHIFANGELVATIVGNGSATSSYIVHTDHLGGTHVMTNASGTVVQTNDYYPYGDTRLSTGSYSDQRGYIGEQYDASTNLNYLNARYYQNGRGQFLSQDPVFWEVGQTKDGWNVLADPQLQNSYSYGRDNPITNKDPKGRCPFCPILIGAGVGAIGGIGVQAFDDYFSGEFSQRTWGETFSTYSVAAGQGAIVGASVTGAGMLTAVAGFTTIGSAITVGGTSGILTAGTTVVGNRLLGKQTGPSSLAVSTVMSTLTAGVLDTAPKVPGRLPNFSTNAFYTGAHATRQGAGELVSSSMQLYGQTVARYSSPTTFSVSGSGGGGSGGSNSSLIQQLQSIVSALQSLVASLSASSGKK